MKKIPILFCTAILLICFLSGCIELSEDGKLDIDLNKILSDISVVESDDTETVDSDLEKLRVMLGKSDSIVGVAFIGYVDSQSTEDDLYTYLENSETGKAYPFLSDAPIVMAEGQELYAIVTNDSGTITVYPSNINESYEYVDDISTPLYTGKNGEVVIVRCNISEIYSEP